MSKQSEGDYRQPEDNREPEHVAEHTVGGRLGGIVVEVSESGESDYKILADLEFSTDDIWKSEAGRRLIRILQFWVDSK